MCPAELTSDGSKLERRKNGESQDSPFSYTHRAAHNFDPYLRI